MKFGEYLLQQMISEWSKYYINYGQLKTLLKPLKKALSYFIQFYYKQGTLFERDIKNPFSAFQNQQVNAPMLIHNRESFMYEVQQLQDDADKQDQSQIRLSKRRCERNEVKLYVQNFDMEDLLQINSFNIYFEDIMRMEIKKTDNFFQFKFLEYYSEFINFFMIARFLKEQLRKQSNQFIVETVELENSFYSFYSNLISIKIFALQNYKAAQKILKKQHKNLSKFFEFLHLHQLDNFYNFHHSELNVNNVFKGTFYQKNIKQIDILINLARDIYFKTFYGHEMKTRTKKSGRQILKKIENLRSNISNKSYFIFGISFVIILFLTLINFMLADKKISIHNQNQSVITQNYVNFTFPLFRGFILYQFFQLSFVWAIITCNNTNINYKRIFALDKFCLSRKERVQKILFQFILLNLSLFFYIFLNYWHQYQNISKIWVYPEYLSLIYLGIIIVKQLISVKNPFSLEGKINRQHLIQYLKNQFKQRLKLFVYINSSFSFILILNDIDYLVCYFIKFFNLNRTNNYTYYNSNENSTLWYNAGNSCLNSRKTGLYIIPFILIGIFFISSLYNFIKSKQKLVKFIKVVKSLIATILTVFNLFYNKYSKNKIFKSLFWLNVAILIGISTIDDLFIDWDFFKSVFHYKYINLDSIYKAIILSCANYQKYLLAFPILMFIGLRFAWILSFLPQILNNIFNNDALLILLIGILEMMRRSFWFYFVIEKKHIQSTRKLNQQKLTLFKNLIIKFQKNKKIQTALQNENENLQIQYQKFIKNYQNSIDAKPKNTKLLKKIEKFLQSGNKLEEIELINLDQSQNKKQKSKQFSNNNLDIPFLISDDYSQKNDEITHHQNLENLFENVIQHTIQQENKQTQNEKTIGVLIKILFQNKYDISKETKILDEIQFEQYEQLQKKIQLSLENQQTIQYFIQNQIKPFINKIEMRSKNEFNVMSQIYLINKLQQKQTFDQNQQFQINLPINDFMISRKDIQRKKSKKLDQVQEVEEEINQSKQFGQNNALSESLFLNSDSQKKTKSDEENIPLQRNQLKLFNQKIMQLQEQETNSKSSIQKSTNKSEKPQLVVIYEDQQKIKTN